ncbi:TolC family protein [Longimicrobium sp.]|jgi:outer membrane protein|uniref:TolC family protein n=1 Tax=Longimicrobium sp. TaxID=2029185 RepID=UPI002EDA4739
MSTIIIRRAAGLSALAALLFALPATAQQPGLTIEQAVASARENNPDMLAQRNDVGATRAGMRAARADFLPSANASAGFGYTAPGEQRFGAQTFGAKPEYYSSNWNLGLQYDISRAKLLQPSIARAQHAATESRIAGYEWSLVMQVRQQYLTALQAGDQVQQAVREVERTREHERLAGARLEVGSGTPLEVRRAQVQRGQAEVALVQRQNTHATEILRLGQLMGVSLAPDTPLTSRFELFALTWNADDLVREAQEANPVIQAARASSGAARTQVTAARSQYLPSVSMQVGLVGSVYSAGNIDPLVQQQLRGLAGAYSSCQEINVIRTAAGVAAADCSPLNAANPAVQAAVRDEIAAGNPTFPFGYTRQPLQASLSISLPIFDGLARERRIVEARVQASDAELAVRAQQQRLELDVRTGVLNAQTAFRTAELQRQVAENAAEELRLARERFRLGAANSLEVTDAQTRLSEAERAVIDAVYMYHKSLAALEALVGRPLR